MPKPPRLPLPPAPYRPGAECCLKRMSPEGQRRTKAFWELRKTNDTASAK